MKAYLIKPFKFVGYGGKSKLPMGTILKGSRTKRGILIKHFYCYGQGEIIPNSYFIELIRSKQF
jgi:hypothetical protein